MSDQKPFSWWAAWLKTGAVLGFSVVGIIYGGGAILSRWFGWTGLFLWIPSLYFPLPTRLRWALFGAGLGLLAASLVCLLVLR
jgi:hypothetical protein